MLALFLLAGALPGMAAEAQRRQRVMLAEEARLRSLPPDQQVFELRLREVKALEAQSRVQPVINVKSSIF